MWWCFVFVENLIITEEGCGVEYKPAKAEVKHRNYLIAAVFFPFCQTIKYFGF